MAEAVEGECQQGLQEMYARGYMAINSDYTELCGLMIASVVIIDQTVSK